MIVIMIAFADTYRLAADTAKALKLLGHLDQRIPAKAFAGEIGPQNPTDESAETFLARMLEACTAASKRKGWWAATTD